MEAPPDPYPTTRQRLAQGFLALVGVCVLYALSSGPVLVFACRTGLLSLDTVLRIYEPLTSFTRKTSTFGLLDHYLYWWILSCMPKDGYRIDPFGP